MTGRVKGYLVYILIGLVYSCNYSKKKDILIDKKSPIQYNINLNQPKKSISLKSFSDIFENEQIIPLKINDSIIIASIDKVIVYGSNYYILDRRFSALYCFDKNGNFLRTYGNVGLGPGEFRSIEDFDIDRINNRIMILSNANLSIYYYALKNASFQKQQKIGLFGTSLSVLPNHNVLIFVNYNNNLRSNKHNIILEDSNSMIIHRYSLFNLEKERYSFSYTGFMKKTNNEIFFCKAFDDTVYQYKNGNFFPSIHFDINSDNIKRYGRDHKKVMASKILLDPNTSFLGNTFLKNDNYIIYSYQKDKMRKYGIYNVKNKKIYILSNGVDDPLLGLLKKPLYIAADNTLIFSISPESAENLKENHTKVWDKLSAKQQHILSLPKMKSSYYLIVSKIKD